MGNLIIQALLLRVTTNDPTETRVVDTKTLMRRGMRGFTPIMTSDKRIMEAQRTLALGRITRFFCQSLIPSPATGRLKSQA